MLNITDYFGGKSPSANEDSEKREKRLRSEDASPGLHDAKKIQFENEAAPSVANDAAQPSWVKTIIDRMDSLDGKISTILLNLAEFKADITTRVVDLEASTKFISNEHDKQKSDILELQTKMAALETENGNLRLSHDRLFKRVDGNEQHSRNECLLLHGVDEAAAETPAQTVDKFVAIVNGKLGINLTTASIKRGHRLGPPREQVERADGKKATRPIIVRFWEMGTRNHVFANKKKLKGTRNVITENLTEHRLRVLKDAQTKYGKTNVWSTEGRLTANHGGKKFPVPLYRYV